MFVVFIVLFSPCSFVLGVEGLEHTGLVTENPVFIRSVGQYNISQAENQVVTHVFLLIYH